METIKRNFMKICAMVLPLFIAALAYAQEKSVEFDVDVDKGGDVWYGNPVIWVVGAAIFILLLVALLRGKKE